MKKPFLFSLFLIFSSSPVFGEAFDIMHGDYVCHEREPSNFTYDNNNIEKIEVTSERLEETESERAKREKEIVECKIDPNCWGKNYVAPWSGPFEISYSNTRLRTALVHRPGTNGGTIYANAEDKHLTILFNYSVNAKKYSDISFFTGGYGYPDYAGTYLFGGTCTRQLQE
jgi:hypothetical protein